MPLARLLALVVTCLTLLAGAATRATAQPVNDDFYDYDIIFWEGSTTGTTVGATRQLDEPYHWWIGEGGSVWVQWLAWDYNACYTVETCGSSFDTVVAVYKGHPEVTHISMLTPVGANDDSSVCGAGSRQSSVNVTVTSPAVYYIAVAGFGKGDSGNYTLSVKRCTPPPNDDYADAQPIHLYQEIDSTTVGATREWFEPSSNYSPAPQDSGSVWFEPIASENECLTVYTRSVGQRAMPFFFWQSPFTGVALTTVPRSSGYTWHTNGSNYLYRSWSVFQLSAGNLYKFTVVGEKGPTPFTVSLEGCGRNTLPALRGDANADGKVNIADVTAIYNYMQQGTQSIPGNADVNCDYLVNGVDALMILHYLRDREEFLYYYGSYNCDGTAYFASLLDPAKKYESEMLNRYEVAYLGTREWSRRIARDPVVVAESIPDYVPVGLYYFADIQLTSRASIFAAWAAMAAFWLALGGLVAWQFRRDWLRRPAA